MLLPSITEVVEEGHKVLVFSQFTSFLLSSATGLTKKRSPTNTLTAELATVLLVSNGSKPTLTVPSS